MLAIDLESRDIRLDTLAFGLALHRLAALQQKRWRQLLLQGRAFSLLARLARSPS